MKSGNEQYIIATVVPVDNINACMSIESLLAATLYTSCDYLHRHSLRLTPTMSY